MSELTDLEIVRRLANLAGYNLNEYCEKTGFTSCSFIDKNKLQMGHISYNPLTNKSLCFDLMIKHGIDFQHKEVNSRCFVAMDSNSETLGECDENPQRAICLAIIKKESNK